MTIFHFIIAGFLVSSISLSSAAKLPPRETEKKS